MIRRGLQRDEHSIVDRLLTDAACVLIVGGIVAGATALIPRSAALNVLTAQEAARNWQAVAQSQMLQKVRTEDLGAVLPKATPRPV